MDEQMITSPLYKSRGFSGRVAESFKFLEKNFKNIFKITIVGLIPVGVLSALTMTFLPVHQLGLGMQMVYYLLMLLFSMAASLYFHSFIYAALEKYGEVGYVPTMKLKDWWPLMKKKMGKVFLFNVCMCLLTIVSTALVIVPFVASVLPLAPVPGMAPVAAEPVSFPLWGICLSVFFFFVLLFVLVPLGLFPNFYMLGSKSLWGSFKASYKLGVPHWGSMFGMGLFTSILMAVAMFLGGLPFQITELVNGFIALSLEEGDVVTLPFYYVGMRVVFAFLGSVIAYYASLLLLVPMAFQYASLVTMQREKKEAQAQQAE